LPVRIRAGKLNPWPGADTLAGPREAHACHDYILPRLRDAGCRDEQVIEQHYFRDGRIGPTVCGPRREPGKQAGYLLKVDPGLSVAAVAAKC